MPLEFAGESLGERARAAFGAVGTADVKHGVPAQEIAGGRFDRGGAGLCREPLQGRTDVLVFKKFFDEVTVGGHELTREIQR